MLGKLILTQVGCVETTKTDQFRKSLIFYVSVRFSGHYYTLPGTFTAEKPQKIFFKLDASPEPTSVSRAREYVGVVKNKNKCNSEIVNRFFSTKIDFFVIWGFY